MIGFGLYSKNAEVTIDHSTVSGNTNAAANDAFAGILHGFGIFNDGGIVSITNSAIVRNAATNVVGLVPGAGGGVYNGGTMFIADSTVAGNEAGTLGGGIANFGKLTLQSVTVARNQVDGFARDDLNRTPYPSTCHFDPPAPVNPGCYAGGGGIWNDNAALATTTMLSTAVALNTQNHIPLADTYAPDCFGGFHSDGHNAVGVVPERFCQLVAPGTANPVASDQLHVDAQLGDLTDDGKPGEAHVPLLSGSPLIDAGGACAARDQLGQVRTDGNHDGVVACDVGAVEFAPSPDGSTLTIAQSQVGGTLVTGAGTWNFGAASNTYGNTVLLNAGETGGWATLLEVANGGQLYAQAGDGSWWLWNNPGWSFSPAPPRPVSPDGSTLTVAQSQAGGMLTTRSGTWTFGTASGVYGNAVLLNAGETGGWAVLLEVANGGQLYAQAGDNSWWLWNNPGWSFSAAPPGPGSPVSPDGSTLTVAQSQIGSTLVTRAGTWNFGASSNADGNAVLLNGGENGGWATVLKVANGGQLYAQASDDSWWLWNNPGWSFSAAP